MVKRLFLALLMIGFLGSTGCVADKGAVKQTSEVQYVTISDSMTLVNGVAHMTVDAIGPWSYASMRSDLLYMKTHAIKELHLTMLNPGGSIFHMFSMYDMLKEAIENGLVLHTHAHTLIASAAVPLFLLGETRTLQPNGYIMIHSHTLKQSEYIPESVNKMAAAWTSVYIRILLERTTMSLEEILLYLGNDRNPSQDQFWMNYNEAKARGFLTE